jgi:glycosyltransferase involved in cell wall biosynthesis
MSEISILVSTFNRKELVKRAIESVMAQSYSDWEMFLIDDQSTDGTQEEILKCYPDKRITYIYNEVNQAAEHGDKIHIKRFVHELANGKYWIYLDSDDYWLIPTLLARQIALFEAYPDAAMVAGGQESYFVPEDRTVFTPGVYPHYLSSQEFLEHFSRNPIACNIIGGARLYNREMFIRSGAFTGNDGRWESGYELVLAPACYGGHVYIDEPCIRTEIRPTNASFNETQLSHFLDSVASVKAGFRKPLLDFPERGLEAIQRRTIQNIGQTYLGNSSHVLGGGTLGYCSAENLSRLVNEQDVAECLK